MATSGSYNALYTRNEIITEALELLGVVEGGETPDTNDINSCARTLNMMVKFWQSRGIALWRNQQIYVFLQDDAQSYTLGPTGTSPATASFTKTEISTAGSTSDSTITVDSITGISDGYTIGVELEDGSLQWTTVNGSPSGSTVTLTTALTDDVEVDANVYAYNAGIQRPLFITEARLHQDSGTEIPVRVHTARNDYMALSTKTTTGKASQCYYDPQTTDGVLYVWPTPDSVKDYLVMTARMPLADFDSSDDDPDFPQEWMLPLAYNLAVLVAPKFDEPVPPLVASMAEQFFLEAEYSAKDYGSLIIEVE